MKSKYDLLKYLAELGYKTGAEIGVSEGYFSEKMFQAVPGLKLYLVDNWAFYRGNAFGKSQKENDKKYQITVDRVKPYNAVILRKTSMRALFDVPDLSLDFVYIDGNHAYDYVMEDLIGWNRKVRQGGMIICDDYYPMRKGGVLEAVNDFTKYHGYGMSVIDPRPYGIKDRGFNEQPTAYWIK